MFSFSFISSLTDHQPSSSLSLFLVLSFPCCSIAFCLPFARHTFLLPRSQPSCCPLGARYPIRRPWGPLPPLLFAARCPLATSPQPVAWLAARLPRDSLNLQFQVASNATTTTGRPLPLYILHIINYRSLCPSLGPRFLRSAPASSLLHGSFFYPAHPREATARNNRTRQTFRGSASLVIVLSSMRFRRLDEHPFDFNFKGTQCIFYLEVFTLKVKWN